MAIMDDIAEEVCRLALGIPDGTVIPPEVNAQYMRFKRLWDKAGIGRSPVRAEIVQMLHAGGFENKGGKSSTPKSVSAKGWPKGDDLGPEANKEVEQDEPTFESHAADPIQIKEEAVEEL